MLWPGGSPLSCQTSFPKTSTWCVQQLLNLTVGAVRKENIKQHALSFSLHKFQDIMELNQRWLSSVQSISPLIPQTAQSDWQTSFWLYLIASLSRLRFIRSSSKPLLSTWSSLDVWLRITSSSREFRAWASRSLANILHCFASSS